VSYSDFDLNKVRKAFGVQLDEQMDLFADVLPLPPSTILGNTLAETVPLAIAINTARA
jgi:hypothetical protein